MFPREDADGAIIAPYAAFPREIKITLLVDEFEIV